jgi:hypothetical protein
MFCCLFGNEKEKSPLPPFTKESFPFEKGGLGVGCAV